MRCGIKSAFKFFIAVLVVLFELSFQKAWSAPCCARSAAAPFLILSDDEAQFNLGFSAVDSVADVTDKVYFNLPGKSDFTSQVRMDGAILLSDRFQAGASAALVGRSVSSNSKLSSGLGLGDLRLSFGYEVLPSWSYSVWKPQGFLFSVITLPTGRSKYELGNGYSSADVSGLGFYSGAFGAIFLKRWNVVDAFFLAEFHYSVPRVFESGLVSTHVVPGFGASTGLGLGWSPGGGALRVGLRIQPRMDQVPLRQGVPELQNSPSLISNCDTGLDLSYMLGSSETLMLSYTDQTLLGYAVNSNLNRVLALNFQHRWER